TTLCEGLEFWRAVRSSALVDGVFRAVWPQGLGSLRSVAAQFSIGVTGHHHRQSGVVRSLGHRQDSVFPVVLGLYQSSSAETELRCANRSG
ncbi:MAG: hypothetical protein WA156_07610, partial [Methylocystis silviterrae]